MVETTGKRLELLKELVPGAAPVGVLWDPRSASRLSWQAAEAAARARRWPLLSLEVRDAGEIEGAFKAATSARAGALLVLPTVLLDAQAPRIVELAAKSRLPVMYRNPPLRGLRRAGLLFTGYHRDVAAGGRPEFEEGSTRSRNAEKDQALAGRPSGACSYVWARAGVGFSTASTREGGEILSFFRMAAASGVSRVL
jgi:hypothetical protein